jgi:S-DNA-T family DNA segregation ATPase FtsK/SpoIIIE
MGAEALLGKGDSLFIMGGMSQPKRVHGAFLSTEECERISEHWIPLTEEVAHLDLMDADSVKSALDLGEDDLLEDARRIVVLAQSGSTSMLQRKLRVGYTRAARLMDMLEELGVVGPFEGSKAREVLVSPEEFEAEG